MVHIYDNILKRILNIITSWQRKSTYDCNNKIDMVINNDPVNNKSNNQMNLKEKIARLIRENEKYFIYNTTRTTVDTIINYNFSDIERLKSLSYSHRISAEIFEKHGIFLYTSDLAESIDAPNIVKCELRTLIGEYGLDIVTEEIAIYIKENYPDKFEISIVNTP